jgi:CubicO group peptidase (beta-lactamase class C family)
MVHSRENFLFMRLFIAFIFIFQILPVFSQNLYFPPATGNQWDTIAPSSLGWCASRIDSLSDFLRRNNTKGCIILKDGKIAYERYFGSFQVDSPWYWASAGKTLTATLVGIAQQEGRLSISDTSSKYLGAGWTSLPRNKEDLITIRHQLTMTSGLNDGVSNLNCTDDTCLTYLADAGTRWAYHNAPYLLLHDVLEQATGQTINNYTLQKIMLPTGLRGLWSNDGVFFSTTRSFARFGLLMLNKGKWNTTTILADTNYYNDMVSPSQLLNKSYGYLWWLNGQPSYQLPQVPLIIRGSLISAAPSPVICGLGKNDQKLYIWPQENLVVVRLGESAGGINPTLSGFDNQLWIEIMKLMCNVNSNHETPISNNSFYPNPGSQFLRSMNPISELQIIDLQGKLVFKDVNQKNEWDIQNLSPGMYWIMGKSQGVWMKQKWVKQ